jgi:uncharacterized protein YqgV (UPF0045/DUF77 family)
MALTVEFTVEPFTDASPGPHVQAAVHAAEERGLVAEFGPFGTKVEGDDALVLSAVDAIVRAAVHAGATRMSLQIVRT